MSDTFSITLSNATVTAPRTLAFIRPPTTRSIEIVRVEVSHNGPSAGQQRVQLVTQVSAFPTLTAKTPEKLQPDGPASAVTGGTAGAAGTSGVNASGEGAGTKTVLLEAAFNAQLGFLYLPAPDERIRVHASSSSGFGVYLPDTPSTTTYWSCTVVFREL